MSRRIEKIVLSMLAIISLGTAAVSACTCPHHQPHEEKVSCHDHAHSDMPEMAIDDGSGPQLSDSDECICADTATAKVGTKSESVKFNKHVARISAETSVTITVQIVPRSPEIAFGKPFYLTDSFYNLSPKRGPPVL